MRDQNLSRFYNKVTSIVSKDRIYLDSLKRLAFGSDASFYRLIPEVVINVDSEEEMSNILMASFDTGTPVTFRSAGTSLAGQTITDSVLLLGAKYFKDLEVLDEGKEIRLKPGVIAAKANSVLEKYGYKLGPDPASINSAMIGGIVANNASGMNCGTFKSSYQTIKSARIVFAGGTVLDTADEDSKRRFCKTNPELIDGINEIKKSILENKNLTEKIKFKYEIKNTMGYSLNSFLDYDDPIEIILHLMVGSEGTLGFLSEVTLETVELPKFTSTAMAYFKNIGDACKCVTKLAGGVVHSIELLDRNALKAVESRDGMPSFIKSFGDNVTALLIETTASSKEELSSNIKSVTELINSFETERDVEFTSSTEEASKLWDIRKGVFPSVGGVRKLGTTCIIEDVAFRIEDLSTAIIDLQRLMKKYNYDDGVIYGHALEGNFHLIFSQDFETRNGIENYDKFMEGLSKIVVDKYSGSLKAEHGTGRNMAPFLKQEWGEEAYKVMLDVKKLFDPKNTLNPEVIINQDEEIHLKNLKPLPLCNENVDKCIECGFCEVNCVVNDFTLSPRQRIVVVREIQRLRELRSDLDTLKKLESEYKYLGEESCVADGLCSLSCPLEIDTGLLTKDLRAHKVSMSIVKTIISKLSARYFSAVKKLIRFTLFLESSARKVLGEKILHYSTSLFRALTFNKTPRWSKALPKAIIKFRPVLNELSNEKKVVYFPSCISQVMGVNHEESNLDPQHIVTHRVLEKAGFEVIYPENLDKLCCGTPWESKGFKKEADLKGAELEKELFKVSDKGRYPIVCDTSPCLLRMRRTFSTELELYEVVEFIHDNVVDLLNIEKIDKTVALHITCSSKKMKLSDKFIKLANLCAKRVIVPDSVGCCGFAGDKGFNNPEINKYALRFLKDEVDGCTSGYSNSRTCEIGLTDHSGLVYKSIVYLVDDASKR